MRFREDSQKRYRKGTRSTKYRNNLRMLPLADERARQRGTRLRI